MHILGANVCRLLTSLDERPVSCLALLRVDQAPTLGSIPAHSCLHASSDVQVGLGPGSLPEQQITETLT